MFCQRCQHSLRGSEGIKCTSRESRLHGECADRESLPEAGDRRPVWRCAACRQPAGAASPAFPNLSAVFVALNNIADKFELVNKIQLPKLNNDLAQIKLVTDRIVKQNEQIISKFEELKARAVERASLRGLRRREVELSPRSAETKPGAGAGGTVERGARYRTRQRAYPLHKMFVMLNRSLYTNRPKRRR